MRRSAHILGFDIRLSVLAHLTAYQQQVHDFTTRTPNKNTFMSQQCFSVTRCDSSVGFGSFFMGSEIITA